MSAMRPLRDDRVLLPDGRSLAYTEWGTLDAEPLLLFHGTPGCRLLCLDAFPEPGAASAAAGVRLVIVDRPGIGASDRVESRSLTGWARDVEALADALGWEKFSLIGWSAGGPHALACAAVIAERLSGVAVVSSRGPSRAVPGARDRMPAWMRELVDQYPSDPPGAANEFLQHMRWVTDDPEEVLRRSDRPVGDEFFFSSSVLREALVEAVREMVRRDPTGFAHDWLVTRGDWDFAPEQIHLPVKLFHGEEDDIVPAAEGRWLAEALPDCDATFWPGEAHWAIARRFAEVLGAVV